MDVSVLTSSPPGIHILCTQPVPRNYWYKNTLINSVRDKQFGLLNFCWLVPSSGCFCSGTSSVPAWRVATNKPCQNPWGRLPRRAWASMSAIFRQCRRRTRRMTLVSVYGLHLQWDSSTWKRVGHVCLRARPSYVEIFALPAISYSICQQFHTPYVSNFILICLVEKCFNFKRSRVTFTRLQSSKVSKLHPNIHLLGYTHVHDRSINGIDYRNSSISVSTYLEFCRFQNYWFFADRYIGILRFPL